MKNKFSKKYKNVLITKSAQGMAKLSLVALDGLNALKRIAFRPFFIGKDRLRCSVPCARILNTVSGLFAMNQTSVGSTSCARVLSRLWSGEKGRRASSTSCARVLSSLGGFRNSELRTGSTSCARVLSLFGALVFAVAIPLSVLLAQPQQVDAQTNTLNFQGRLLTNTGTLVPDGNYHIEFKLYNALSSAGSSQGSCTGDTNCLWTETLTTGNLVSIQNGYFSVYLGDVTALPDIDWSQALYLGMNVGGDAGSASWDGEMSPRFRLTSVPYAFTSRNVATNDTNAASTDSDNVTIQTGDALGATSDSGDITIDVGSATGTAGSISLGATNASALTLGRAGLTTTNAGALTVTQTLTASANLAVGGNLNLDSGVVFFNSTTDLLQIDGNTIIGDATTDTLTVEADATFNGSLVVSAGDQFTNAGSTLFTAVSIANDVDGGVLGGSAAATVDVATTINIAQTTTGQTFTLASPTDTTSGRIIYINNTGTADITLEGNPLSASSSASYIWNGSAWKQTLTFSSTGVDTIGALDGGTANANGASISGTTIYLQSADGTYAGLVNTSAQNFAGVKTFNDGAVIAAGQTLRVVGGNTASRPGSPSAGEIYYDTDTNSFLVYNGTKWVADQKDAIYVASTSTSSQADQDRADYLVDGESGDQLATIDGDQVEINAALTAAAGAKVILLEGTYEVDGTILIPNNTTLEGVGPSTIIEFADIDATDNLIENSDTSTGTNVAISDLTIDGRRDLNTIGVQNGIYLSNMGGGTGASGRKGALLTGITAVQFSGNGIYITNSALNTVDNNILKTNSLAGIYTTSSNRNTYTNNSFIFNYTDAISFNFSTDSIISSNVFREDSSRGVRLENGSNRNTVSNNTFINIGNTTANNGIYLNSSDANLIIGNYITDSSCTTTCYAINISDAASDNNYLADNTYSASGANQATINDAGTGTIYANQQTPTKILQNSSTLIRGNASTALTGTADPDGTTTLTGTGTLFLTELQIGDRITINAETRTVTAIASNTSLTVDTAFSDTAPGSITRLPAALKVTNAAGTTTGLIVSDQGFVGIGTDIASNLLTVNTPVTADSTADVQITTSNSSTTALVLQGSVGQTVNIFEIQGSGGGATLGFTTSGRAFYGGISTPFANDVVSSINALSSAYIGQVIRGVASQTGDLQQFQNNSGTVLSGFNSSGSLFVGTTTAPNKINVNLLTTADTDAQVAISTGGTSNTGLVVQGVAGQTANIFEVQGSAGTSMFQVLAVGDTVSNGNNNFANGLRLGGAYGSITGRLEINTVNDSRIGQIINGTATQTANLLQLQNNATVLSGFNNAGNLFYANSTFTSVLQSATLAADRTITLPDATGTVLLDSTLGTTAFLQNGNSFGATAVLGTNDLNSLAFETNNTTYFTLNTSGVLTGSNGATISVPGAGTNNEQFGAGASATGSSDSTAVGNGATASAQDTTAIGSGAIANASDGIAIGNSATANGADGIAIGNGSTGGYRGVVVGNGSSTGGNQATVLGYNATASGRAIALGEGTTASTESIAIGVGATTTASNQLVIGSTGEPISQAYIGSGVTSATPTSIVLNATGGSGTDIAGASLTLAGGRGTGTGVGGDILFRTAAAGSTGTTLNALGTILTLSGSDGSAVFQNTTDSTTGFQVLDANGGAPIFNVDTTNERVGIGTAAPSTLLSLRTNDFQFINLDRTGDANVDSTFDIGVSYSGLNNDYLYLGGASTLVVTDDGAVGIGTNDPTSDVAVSDLTVADSGNAFITIDNTSGTFEAGLVLRRGTANWEILNGSSGSLTFESAGTEVVSFSTAGLLTLASDLAVNGGDITSTQSTFNLLNGTVTTLNIGGTATAIELGAATGTTSINNTLTVDGNITLGNANTDTITINAGTSGSGIQFGDASFQNCILSTNGSGVLSCSASGSIVTLQAAYTGGNTILATDAEGDIDLTVSEATSFSVDITGTGSFLVQDGGVTVLEIADGGQSTFSDAVSIDGSADTVQLRLQANGTQTNALFVAESSAGSDYVVISGTGNLQVLSDATFGSTNYGGKVFIDGDSDEVQLRVQGGAGQTANVLEIEDSAGADFLSISATGAAAFQNASNSTSGFRINNAAGSAMLEADTTNYLLKVAPTQFLSSGSTQTFGTSGSVTGVDSFSTIAVNATAEGLTVTVPVPVAGGQVVGRVVYITAVNGSEDFNLSLGGTSIDISMKENSTATLIWNGTGWTAAGASSSTDLQSAYSNTLTSAGGAEIVLNPSGGAADGLTVRNNETTPIIGAIFETQTSVGSNLFSVNNNAIEYADNGGAEDAFASEWSATPGGGTVTRYTTQGNYIATGIGSVQAVTTGSGSAGQGAENTLTSALTPNLRYSVSFAVRATTNFSTLDVYYSPDGTTTGEVACTTGETVSQGRWTRVICTFDAPASGITSSNAIFIRQSDSNTNAYTYYVENLSVTVKADVNHAADGDVDSAGNFSTNWTATGAATASYETTVIYNTSASARAATTAAVGDGIRNNLAIAPDPSTQYLVTFYAQSSNTFDDIRVRYSRDGGTSFVSCTDYNTQSVSTVSWTQITCLFETDSTTPTNADLIIDQPTATARNFYIDGLEITLNENTANNVQIGGGSLGGPTTLLTLDRSAGPPVGANNDAYLGSMYYDTVTGRIQCYESGGWGTCGAPPDNIVNLNPEYAGSVLNGSGIGTMQADVCANESGVLQVNSTLCGSGEARSFYTWTSPQATQQTYSIYVTYQLPSTFDGFASDDTVTLTGRVSNTSNAAVTYEMFRSESGAITKCGTGETTVATTANTWQTVGINGNEATGCGFTSNSANAFVIFKINLKANSNADAYVSTLSFTTTGR